MDIEILRYGGLRGALGVALRLHNYAPYLLSRRALASASVIRYLASN
jgi:hypothetical protein